MATPLRSIDSRFWSDPWVRSLTVKESYAFLYFLTNQHSSWCGVYELDINVASFETKISKRELIKILPKLEPKVLYLGGWVCITNFEKYHKNGSKDTNEGIKKAWDKVPPKIRLNFDQMRYPQGSGVGVSSLPYPSLPNLSSPDNSERASKEAGKKYGNGPTHISKLIK